MECFEVEHTISLDGKKEEVRADATIAEVMEQHGIAHVRGTKVGVLRATSKEKMKTDRFVLHTTRGDVELKVALSAADVLAGFGGLPVVWKDDKSVMFGYHPVSIEPSTEEIHYERGDVFFATSGFEAEKGELAFSLKRHSAAYGGSEKGEAGRVIRGEHVLDQMGEKDQIRSIEPVFEVKRAKDFLLTDDLTQTVPEGAMLFTGVDIALSASAPVGSEHVLAALAGGVLDVDVSTASFASCDGLQGELCPFEELAARRRGTVSVRTEGFGGGRIYISKQDRASSWMHSVVGEVVGGMELLDFAGEKDRLTVRLKPERLSLYGHTFKDAEEMVAERGVVLERDGYVEDDGIIVAQDPHTTLDTIEHKKVKALGAPPSQVLDVLIYRKEAPASVKYLSRALGLAYKPIGEFSVVFTYENTILLKPESTPKLELLPENTPSGMVAAGEMGITNQAAKRSGVFGLKLLDDKRYGPTGEKFHATNIVARVESEQFYKLRGLKQKDVVYMREKREVG
ncbi:MAG: methyl-coenzyme M reductase-associated protein Mmp3 [Methermicoccaceae archaeon]